MERALTIACASADVLDAHAKGGASALAPLTSRWRWRLEREGACWVPELGYRS
jgi:hypothetical protein